MTTKIPVTILAGTGTVGQRFVQLLDGHPWFEVTALTGSDRSAGKPYGEACHWLLANPMPEWARSLRVLSPDAPVETPLVFSALPADAAQQIEPALAGQGKWVCSNASAFRSTPDVPLVLPEVNPGHLDLLETQQRQRGWSGGIITNPNCASTGITIALKAFNDAFGLRRAFVVTLQSISGAGYPGVASMDIIDNVIPYIGGEEDKVEWEPRKMLGSLDGGQVRLSDVRISAQVNRVSTTEGHMACLSVEFERSASADEAADVLRKFRLPKTSAGLPSSPQPVILVRDEPDRPQPRLDRATGQGMSTVVGRVRPDPLFDLKLVVLSHNTIRGAAGASIYNAELLVRSGRLGYPFEG
jgi:aspartate-semialdehyde dehydrogenase